LNTSLSKKFKGHPHTINAGSLLREWYKHRITVSRKYEVPDANEMVEKVRTFI